MKNINITSFQASTTDIDWDIDMVRGLATCEVQIRIYPDGQRMYETITIDLLCAVKYIDRGPHMPCRMEWAPSWEHECIGDFVRESVREASKAPSFMMGSTANQAALVEWIKREIPLPKRPSLEMIRSSLSIVAEDPEGRFVVEAGTVLGEPWVFLSDRKSSSDSSLCVWPFATQRDIDDAVAEFFRISASSLSRAIVAAIDTSKDQHFSMADYITSKEMA